MSAWQLVAHPEADVCNMAVLSLQSAFKQHKLIARVDSVTNIAAAQDSLSAYGEAEVDLVVIASTMPADDRSSMGSSSREATKEFIKQVKRHDPALPVIVASSTPDERLADFLDAFENTGLVTVGPDFGSGLARRAAALLESTRSGKAHAKRLSDPGSESWIHVDIHLANQRGGWQMNRVGCDEFEAQGTLQVDDRQLDRLIRDSKRLDDVVARNSDEWLERLKELSNDLRDLLFRSARANMDFWDKFVIHRERVGGVAHSRIRLTVDEKTYSMLFEALRDSEADDEFWVLNAPVFRRYAQQMAQPPLFKDAASREKPINCLVIEADPEPGVVVHPSGKSESFVRLRYLGKEADQVEAMLLGHAGGVVERVRLGGVDGALDAHLLAKLAERQWHVVHFCGHVSGDDQHASLVLRADEAGLLPVKALASALRNTQLLFLSSCRSASTRMVMHAVERHVAAVVGFQWVIDDGAAFEFAVDFYHQLLNATDAHARDLEYALLEARRKAYKRNPGQPSWVAPVLVMQMR